VRDVIDVFEIPTGVAVVANGFYAAKKGREALKLTWDDTHAEKRSSEQILSDHQAIAAGKTPAAWAVFEKVGDAEAAFAGSAAALDFHYDFPYLAHATMEPMNCVAKVDGSRLRLIFGAQSQTVDQMNTGPIVGAKPEEVELETLPCGGSFGRRSVATSDFAKECVHIAKQCAGRPVKLVWTREDDMAGGYYRPIAHHAIRIKLDTEGYPQAWDHKIVSASLLVGTPFEASLARDGYDKGVVEGVAGSPYFKAVQAVKAAVASPRSPVTVLWLRSVGATHTAMVMEHTIDQLAARAKVDPVDYRRALYRKAGADRHLRVLELAAQKADWGKPLAAGWARGIAVHECFGSVVANVAEVTLAAGVPKVRRVVVAVDCGFAVSPDQVRAQMEGGVNFGLSFAMFGDVKIKDGIVQTTNFHRYRVLRFEEAPLVETFIVPSANAPSGTGEPGTPVIGPAVANALLALTGKATSVLPFVKP
jgi:isoquinoline 1-oxidoreductase beta subunit